MDTGKRNAGMTRSESAPWPRHFRRGAAKFMSPIPVTKAAGGRGPGSRPAAESDDRENATDAGHDRDRRGERGGMKLSLRSRVNAPKRWLSGGPYLSVLAPRKPITSSQWMSTGNQPLLALLDGRLLGLR